MVTSQRSRRHHSTPQFYLRRFADRDDRILAFDLRRRRLLPPQNVRNVGFENDFHTIVTNQGPDDGIEHLVGALEGQFARGFASLPEDFPPSDETRAHVAMFVALQFIRTPAWRELLRTGEANLRKELAQFWANIALHKGPESVEWKWHESLMEIDDREQMRQLLERTAEADYKLSVGSGGHLLQILDVLSDIRYSRAILRRAWTLVHATEPAEFITSDNPVVMYGDGDLGLGTAESIALPINRNWLLEMTLDQRDEGKLRRAPPGLVAEYNSGTRSQASRFLFAHPLIQKRTLTG